MTARNHTLTAVILVIVGLYLIRLSSVEIQPWDEGLYAVRGESIVLFGEWWDQTPHALGGLYSSTPPPMVPWGVALGTSLFGHAALGVRIFTILCSGLALLLLYQIARRSLSYQGSIAATVILGTAIPWVVYSRQAMTEVPLMMFTLLGLYAALRSSDRAIERSSHRAIEQSSNRVIEQSSNRVIEQSSNRATSYELRATLLGIVSIAGALMTKMVVGFLPVLFFLPLLRRSRTRWFALAVIGGGLLLAAPWYAMMFSRYGDDIWLAMSVPHLFTAVEGNTSGLGPLYYLSQLIKAHPAFVAVLAFVVMSLFRRTMLPSSQEMAVRLALLWFVAGMLVLSVAPTKNPHYVVLLLPPAALLASYAFEKIVAERSRTTTVRLYGIVLGSAALALDPTVLGALRAGQPSPLQWTILGAAIGLAVSGFLVPRRWVDDAATKGFRLVPMLVLIVGGLSAATIVFAGRAEEIRGGRQVAVALLEQAEYYKDFAYLYHRRNAGDAMNPQLAWYTAGWMNGWDEKRSYVPLHMPPNTYDLNAVAELATAPVPWVVYYHPGIADSVQTSVMAGLAIAYDVHDRLEHYTLFVRR